jgi:hypothetical protein
MSPDLFRKLAALGLNTEQIAGVLEIMETEAEARKEKARARWHKWKDKQPTNVGKRLPTTANVSKPLTRAEDSSSRLDISGKGKEDDASPTAQLKATRIPENFIPDTSWAVDQGMTPAQARVESSQFIDFWRGKSGKDGTKQDWPATWRVWVRNSIKRQPTARSGAPPNRRRNVVDVARERGGRQDDGPEDILGSRGNVEFLPARIGRS